jgi:carbon storage regulator
MKTAPQSSTEFSAPQHIAEILPEVLARYGVVPADAWDEPARECAADLAFSGVRSHSHFPDFFKEEAMLVLSRKNRETVVIDGRITIKVLQIKGSTIRLGIEAPGEVSIRRGELPEEANSLDGAPPRLEIVAEEPQIISYTCAAS